MNSKYKQYYHIILGLSVFCLNYSFYFITWPLVALIGYKRKSVEELINCQIIVLCYVLDIAVLPMVIGMNFKEVSYFDIFEGKFTDFDSKWY